MEFAGFRRRMRFHKGPVTRRFKTLKEYSEATGQDKHSVLVDYDSFVKVPQPR